MANRLCNDVDLFTIVMPVKDRPEFLKRSLDSVKNVKTDLIVRITGDDILIDPHYLDLTVTHHLQKNLQ